MATGYYITARVSKFPLDYAVSSEEAQALLKHHQAVHPDATIEPMDSYFERSRAETLTLFPLSRITRRFYEAMLGVLPPQYMSGVAGFFLSEAVTERIHAQFIEYNGRTYGGYADLARETRRIWTIADIVALESQAGDYTPTLDWFPAD